MWTWRHIKFYLYLLWGLFWRSSRQFISHPVKSSVQNFRTLKRVVSVPRFRREKDFPTSSSPLQEVHGGQTWQKLGDKFVCDFSVTTSVLGPPRGAIRAARRSLPLIDHYPEQDAFEARKALAEFTDWPAEQLLLGNGASEFIDLCLRGNPEATWRPGPWPCQFMEYERSAKANGLIKQEWNHNDPFNTDVDYTIIVNPSSPTGDYMSLKELEIHIAATECVWVIDESFITCKGPDWRKHSCLNLVEKYPGRIIIIVSWTKVYACPGLRIGSVASTQDVINNIQSIQVPWSVNIPAQKFIISAVRDRKFMRRTWYVVPRLKKRTERLLKRLGFTPNSNSPSWVPWVYVDCHSEKVAARLHDVALDAGLPVRHCKSFGQPTFLRLGIRTSLHQNMLFKAWLRDQELYNLFFNRVSNEKVE
ncbi:hypothetical protein P9112_007762 [Eukaryota sp. TZLM1-RC]